MSLPPEVDELDTAPAGDEAETQPAPPRPAPAARPFVLRVVSHAAKLALFLTVATSVLGFGIPGVAVVFPTRFDAASDSVPPAGDAEAAEATPTIPPVEVAGLLPAAQPAPSPQPLDDDALIAAAAAVRQHASDAVPTPPVPGKALQIRGYRVQPGDTLLALAVEFGVTPETILWSNSLGNGDLLRIGEQLIVPPVSGIVHRAQKQDTVATIADAYGADPGAVRLANALDGDQVAEGQLIIVPGGVKRTTAPIEGLPNPPSAEELAAAPHYTVLAGDSLVSIADAFGVRPSIIQVTNNLLDPDALRPGQDLVIPGGKRASAAPQVAASPTAPPPSPTPTATAAPTAPTAGDRYLVKSGDTLFSIARALGVPMQALADANGLADPSKLRVGQSLVIPAGAKTPAPAASPTRAATQAPAATPVPATPVPATPTPRPAQPTPAPAPSKPAPTAVPAPLSQPTGNPANGQKIATIAQKYIGFRYVWGGSSPTGFDCSGFTWYVFREAGFNIPQHNLPGQLAAGPRIAREQLLPGDLVFFQNTYMPGLSHVGIFLGGGRFINAETESVGVQVRSLTDPYWAARFYGASRPW